MLKTLKKSSLYVCSIIFFFDNVSFKKNWSSHAMVRYDAKTFVPKLSVEELILVLTNAAVHAERRAWWRLKRNKSSLCRCIFSPEEELSVREVLISIISKCLRYILYFVFDIISRGGHKKPVGGVKEETTIYTYNLRTSRQ